jgi:hypothetical protein
VQNQSDDDEDYLPSQDLDVDDEDDDTLLEINPEIGLHLEMELDEEDGFIEEVIGCPRSIKSLPYLHFPIDR